MQKNIQAILFDFDGVLYMPTHLLDSALKNAVVRMIDAGLDTDKITALDKLKEIRKEDSNAEDHFDKLCEYFNHKKDPSIIAAGIGGYHDSKIGAMYPVDKAHPVLCDLKKHYPLVIISNGDPIKQNDKINRLKLTHYFQKFDENYNITDNYIFISNDEGKKKPNSYLFERAQEKLGFSFDRTVMIGNRYWTDIHGANRLGIITVKIENDETIDDVLEKHNYTVKKGKSAELVEQTRKLLTPDYKINYIKELPFIVKQIEKTNNG